MRVTLIAESPIHHAGFGVSMGNAAQLRRMTLVSHPDRPRVPVLSGNALRGILRRLIMRHMLAQAGLDRTTLGAQWDRLYAALVNGGHLESSETRVSPEQIRALREALPPLSVFGAALYSHFLPGHMSVGIAWLRCLETTSCGLTTGGYQAADDLVEDTGQVRHVDREQQDPEVSGVTPMPTEIEVVCAGSAFESIVHFASTATDIERACIPFGLHMLRTVGGKIGSGFGRVRVEHDGDPQPYVEWLERATANGSIATSLRDLADRLGKTSRKAKR